MENKTIYKYEIPVRDNFELELPYDSKILCVQIDGKTGKPCIWAEHFATNEPEKRKFALFGTGWPIHRDLRKIYIGTSQLDNGDFIQHLFELF